jgi:hypothetical protein
LGAGRGKPSGVSAATASALMRKSPAGGVETV